MSDATPSEAPQAWLQEPSGAVAHRIPLLDPEPWELEHAGFVWVWSERHDGYSVYERGRAVSERE